MSNKQSREDALLLLDREIPAEVSLSPFIGYRVELQMRLGVAHTPILTVAFDGQRVGDARRSDAGWEFIDSDENDADDADDAVPVPQYLMPHQLRGIAHTRGDWSNLTEADLNAHLDYIESEFHELVDAMITLAGCGFRVMVSNQEIARSEAELSLRATTPDEISTEHASKAFKAWADSAPGEFVIRYRTRQGHWGLDEAGSGIAQGNGHMQPCGLSTMTRIALLLAPAWCFVEAVDAPGEWHSGGASIPGSSVAVAIRPTATAPAVSGTEADQRKQAVAAWAAEHSFSEPLHKDWPIVLDYLQSRGEGLMGYYVLQFSDGECYVGQSQNLPRRTCQDHPKRFKDIESIRVRPDIGAADATLPLRHLLTTERQLIHSVQGIDAPARNMSDMTITSGTRGFNELVPLDDQQRWLASPDVVNRSDGWMPRSIDPDDFTGARQTYCRLRDEYPRHADQIERIIGAYIARCIPFPRRTEYRYWSVSALPSLQNKLWRRVACVTTSWTETLVVTEYKPSHTVVGFLQATDIELFGEDESIASYLKVVRRHPGMFDLEADYMQSGPGNTVLHTVDLNGLERLLDDTAVTRAAATAALNIMNKRGVGRVKESHNPHLVDAAIRGNA